MHVIWFVLWITLPLAAQGPGPHMTLDESPGIPKLHAASANLLGAVTRGNNFHGQLPTGGVGFELENQGDGPASIWMVYSRKDGNRQSRILKVPAHDFITISGDPLAADDHITILSMQPFSVTTMSPLEDETPTDRKVPVHAPAARLTLKSLTIFNGSTITVGIDKRGNCHYPIHGEIIGSLLENGAIKLHEDGAVLEPESL